jgi:multimeric flavodoxin WrbA
VVSMAKVLVMNGSPKAVSDTMQMTKSFLEGLNQNKQFDIEIIDVIKKNIGPCRGCFKCWERGEGHCIYDDDQNEILDKYISADIIIWSFPLYCYAMPSHVKAVLDRTIPLNLRKMVEVDGRVQHVNLVDFSKKKTIVICGCGFPDWEGNFTGLRIMCRNAFGNPIMICVPEAPMMNVPQAKIVTDPLKKKFAQAGKEFSENYAICEDTIAALETPMIPKEQYMAIVNGA